MIIVRDIGRLPIMPLRGPSVLAVWEAPLWTIAAHDNRVNAGMRLTVYDAQSPWVAIDCFTVRFAAVVDWELAAQNMSIELTRAFNSAWRRSFLEGDEECTTLMC